MKKIVFLLIFTIGFTGIAETLTKKYFIPHIPAETNYWECYLVADNLGNTDSSFKLILFNESGNEVYNENINFNAFAHLEINLYSKSQSCISGEIEIEDSATGIFYIVYKNIEDGGTAKIKLQNSASPTIAFNFGSFINNLTWKGLALCNTSSSGTAVTFIAFDSNMNEIGKFEKTLPANGHSSFVLNSDSSFGTNFNWQDCVRVYAVATSSLSGVNISGVNSEKLLFGAAENTNVIPNTSTGTISGEYKIIAWNDLGMHCYDDDYSVFTILPPYNTLWAQVVKTGATPEVVTSGITVSYMFENNTTSVGKTNFWEYEQDLFGVNLPQDTGLKGKTLNDTMDADGDHFVAEGIPLTQFNDDMSVNYYQTAIITAKNAQGEIIARTRTIAPVSNEMHCSNCHNDNGADNIATGNFRTNILQLHDNEEGTSLMGSQPVLCASCHTSNALGTSGSEDHLSRVIHKKHAEHVQVGTNGCYNCHPGPDTKCLRGVMFEKGMQCTDCHGDMNQVADKNRNPWLDEPNCGDCHDYGTPEGSLYRMSTGHGGMYCSSCHGSPHAILPSSNPVDNQQSILLQGKPGIISDCSVCHTDGRTGDNPHEASSHPDGWKDDHGDYVEDNGYTSCATCHGSDYKGGWSGVSCYQCHDGPSGEGGDDD